MSMRITNNMMANDAMRYINNAGNRKSKADEQKATGKKISLPSDDPVVATRSIKYRNYVDNIKQYKKNVEDIQSWQKVTHEALNSLSDVISKMRELTSKAAGGVNDSDKKNIADEVGSLLKQAIDIMNSDYGGRYIFGGYATSTPPYSLATAGSGGSTYEVVNFKGKYLDLVVNPAISDADIANYVSTHTQYTTNSAQSMKIDIGYGSEMTVNIEGQEAIGEGSGNLFNTFSKLLLALDGKTSYKTWDSTANGGTGGVVTNSIGSIDSLLDDIDADYQRVLTAQATLGARMNHANSLSERLDTDYTTYDTLQSNNEDVDLAKAAIEQSNAQVAYEASLSVGAKAISKTLLDYLA